VEDMVEDLLDRLPSPPPGVLPPFPPCGFHSSALASFMYLRVPTRTVLVPNGFLKKGVVFVHAVFPPEIIGLTNLM